MVGKRGKSGLVLMILLASLFIILIQNVAAVPCNPNEIVCDTTCYGPGIDYSTVTCNIKDNVTVDVQQTDVNVVSEWKFKKLEIKAGNNLSFINSKADKSAPGTWGGLGGFYNAGLGGLGVYGAGSGGNGGTGYVPGNYQEGGGGGGGGAGGAMFLRGGKGGDGSQGGGGDHGDGGVAQAESNYSGANVKITVEEFVIGDNALLSVSGQDGAFGPSGIQGSKSGGGGAGGGGGSGGGKLVLTATVSIDYGTTGAKITANGGIGGYGGWGALGTKKHAGGGGAGGGGGGNAGEVNIIEPNSVIGTKTVETSGGAGGIKGETNGDGGNNGYPGTDGTSTAPFKEYETPSGDRFYAQCSDTVDNNGNTLVDMNDPGCRETMLPWDATIWDEYTDAQKLTMNYDTSAKNGADLACGDDLGLHCNWNGQDPCNGVDVNACALVDGCAVKDVVTGYNTATYTGGPCASDGSTMCSQVGDASACGSGWSETGSTSKDCVCRRFIYVFPIGMIQVGDVVKFTDTRTCQQPITEKQCAINDSSKFTTSNVCIYRPTLCTCSTGGFCTANNLGIPDLCAVRPANGCSSTGMFSCTLLQPPENPETRNTSGSCVSNIAIDAESCIPKDVFSGNPLPNWQETPHSGQCSGQTYIAQKTCIKTYDCVNTYTLGACKNLLNKSDCSVYQSMGVNACVWTQDPYGTKDLGAITGDNNYLCTDSYNQLLAKFKYPGLNYSWVAPDGTVKKVTDGSLVIENPFWIIQAEETHFISNGDSWFYCNATSATPRYGNQGLTRGGTFTLPNSNGNRKCIDTFEAIHDPEEPDLNIIECSGSQTDCEGICDAAPATDECNGWCKTDASYALGHFSDDITGCGSKQTCEYRNPDTGNYVSISNYINNIPGIKDIFCNITANLLEPECTGVLSGPSAFNGGSDLMNQELCQLHPEICLGQSIPSTATCQAIHESFNYAYPDPENGQKLCEKGEQYCKNGILVYSSESNSGSDSKYCCLGQNAYCTGYNTPQDCTALGGILKSSIPTCDTVANGNCVCTGITLGTDNDCCVDGQWTDPTSVLLNPNASYVCYSEDGRSHIQECCGVDNCNNKLNDLNKRGPGFPPSGVYSMKGVPLHGLISFDDIITDAVTGEDVLQRQVRTIYELKTGDTVSMNRSNRLYDYVYYDLDWSKFSHLEFDIMYNEETNGNVSIVDSAGNACDYSMLDNIAVRKGPLRWQHVTIPLDTPIACTGTLIANQITSIGIVIGQEKDINGVYVEVTNPTIAMALDNFFLKPNNTNPADLTADSPNEFCSGDWGKWVKNLDGPGTAPNVATPDNGFVGVTPAPGITDIGPYKDACNGVISFGWTGNVCCGDDTMANKHGEYWNDTEGACWNGTAVLEDQTVASARGNDNYLYANQTEEHIMDELSLLYYGGKLWSCDRALDNYTKYTKSYDGIVPTLPTDTMNKFIEPKVVEPYTIKGNWFCETDGLGWVKLANVNRIKPLAATLRKIGEVEGGNYTLMCGDYSKLSNVLNFNESNPEYLMTKNICVLKVGDNKLGNPNSDFSSNNGFSGGGGFVVIGLEVADIALPFDEYKAGNSAAPKGVLNSFLLLKAQEYDCSAVPSDVTPDKFFTQCGDKSIDTGNSIYLYYNKPLNIILISGNKDLSGVSGVGAGSNTGFVQFLKHFWTEFKRFIDRLFHGVDPSNNIRLADFQLRQTKDLYLSVQENRMIVGAVEQGYGKMTIRVDYVNLSTDVRILRDAIQANYKTVTATYIANGTNQTIFVTGSFGNTADWRLITSILRINPAGSSLLFQPTMYPSCTDEDGGINYTLKGTTFNASISLTDSCKDANNIYERYCDGSNVLTDEHACASGTCHDGACGSSQPPSGNTCVDSDLGPNQYITKGYTTVNGALADTDSCADSADVTEYYCSSTNTSVSLMKACAQIGTGYTCSNGACVPPAGGGTCVDSDGGLVYNVIGTVTVGGIPSGSDSCINTGVVNEYYCSSTNTAISLMKACSEVSAGYTCSNGVCGSPSGSSTCVDSDGGLVYNVMGTLTVNGAPSDYSDICFDGSNLNEFYCSSTNTAASSTKACSQLGAGYTCILGACVPPGANNCVNSDSGPNEYFTKGYVSVNGAVVFNDECFKDITGMRVTEAYCDSNNQARTTVKDCTYLGNYHCADGACVPG
jgi:hypothetical protein